MIIYFVFVFLILIVAETLKRFTDLYYVIFFLGTIIDSILGASIQAIYLDEDDKETERKISNGNMRRLSRGFKLINNDFVNITSIFLATLITLIFL